MPLTPPNLDSRTFAQLVEEARQRIPRFTPDWTNLNDSDPGMTLVKLNAWLTETVLYELNRVPDLTYIKFLQLLQVRPEPARAATTELQFRLKPLSQTTDPLRVLVPKGTKVAVDDNDLEQEVLFETDRTLEAVNAAIGAVIVPNPQPASELELLTEYDSDTTETTWLHAATPLIAAGDIAWYGLVLRPTLAGDLDDYSQDVFPAGPLDFFVDIAGPTDTDAAGNPLVATPLVRQDLFPWEEAARAAGIRWQVYIGTDPTADFDVADPAAASWRDLSLVGDSSAGLSQNGHLRLEMPERVGRASMIDLPRSYWERLGLAKPPQTVQQFADDLDNAELTLFEALQAGDAESETLLADAGIPADLIDTLMTACATGEDASDAVEAAIVDGTVAGDDTLDVDPGRWLALDAGFDDPATPKLDGTQRPLIWLRAILTDVNAAPTLINSLALNTVPATAAATRLDERLGNSDGRPSQRFTLAKTPVLIDPQSLAPALELEVGGEIWRRSADFYSEPDGTLIDADSPVYTLDETAGQIAFGDGRRGRIPVAGALVRAVSYRWGGGAIGNAGPNTVTKPKGAIRHVDSVTNPVPAANGKDAEPQDDVILRAPHTLRSRDRAVTADDFAELAAATPTVAVHRAYAIARYRPDENAPGFLAEQPGAVTVVVLPKNEGPKPTPDQAQLAAVGAHLEPRRLITTELYVTGPRYVEITSLSARLVMAPEARLIDAEEAARAALLAYLDPLTGGEDGRGWPFAGPIAEGALYRRLLQIADVRRVVSLSLTLADTGIAPPADTPADLHWLADGFLPYLPATALDVRAEYDTLA